MIYKLPGASGDYQRCRCFLMVNVTGTVTEEAPVALSVILPV